jgi:uncharacterized protein YaiI (UPF0178 family)
MKIWVDADACPVVIREMLCRAAKRTEVTVTFVANQFIRVEPSPYIKFIQVARGFDVADGEIVNRVHVGDLVITGDIPLAAEAIEKGGLALNHRGELYTSENIKECLNMRDFMDTLRGSGIETGGQSALRQSDHQAFANQLDKFLVQATK